MGRLTTFIKSADRRKGALTRLAVELHAIGRRGSAYISELFVRIADAAEYDLEQTVELMRPIMELATEFAGNDEGEAGSKLYLSLGVRDAAIRKAALERLTRELEVVGYRRHSIGDLAGRIADAADADFERAAFLLGEVMNLAAQSYVAAAEEGADLAAGEWLKDGPYSSERAAKLGADRSTNPVIVRLQDGSYDWFPAGRPIGYVHDQQYIEYAPDYYQVIARYIPGRGWKATDR